jgi:TetR/AcrR family transcriptional regulator
MSVVRQLGPQLDMRRQRGVRARAEILRAAERIFAVNGLEGARTEAIAEAARVNKALLFYHFKSKDELFGAVAEDVFGKFHREAMGILSTPGPAKDVLLRFLDLVFDALAARPDLGCLLQRAILTDSKLTERVVRKYFVPRLHKLAALIDRGVRDGDFRRVDAFQAALSVNGLIAISFLSAFAVKSITGIDPLSASNLRKRREAVVEFVRHGLFRSPEVIRHEA